MLESDQRQTERRQQDSGDGAQALQQDSGDGAQAHAVEMQMRRCTIRYRDVPRDLREECWRVLENVRMC